MDQIEDVAQDVATWLAHKVGVTLVQPPTKPGKPKQKSRFPRPPFLPRPATPTFEVRFTFKGQPRVFRYFIEHLDDVATVKNTLRVHTNGELMVLIPDQFGALMPNDIYYGNRSATAAVFGQTAPRT